MARREFPCRRIDGHTLIGGAVTPVDDDHVPVVLACVPDSPLDNPDLSLVNPAVGEAVALNHGIYIVDDGLGGGGPAGCPVIVHRGHPDPVASCFVLGVLVGRREGIHSCRHINHRGVAPVPPIDRDDLRVSSNIGNPPCQLSQPDTAVCLITAFIRFGNGLDDHRRSGVLDIDRVFLGISSRAHHRGHGNFPGTAILKLMN